MSLIPVDSSPTAEAVEDEAVACLTAVEIGGTTYYRGRVLRRPRASVLGASGGYGAWTATAKGGTRLTVKPGSGDGAALPSGTGEVTIDLVTGRVYSTTSRTVYFWTEAHGEYLRATRVALVAQMVAASADGTVEDLAVIPVPSALDVVGYSLNVQPGGYAPAAAVGLSVRSARGGAGSALSAETLDLGSGETDSGAEEFATPWRVEADTLVVVRGDGQGMERVLVTLWGVPA